MPSLEPKQCAIPGPFINELANQSQVLPETSLQHGSLCTDCGIRSTMDFFSPKGSKAILTNVFFKYAGFLMSVYLCCFLSPSPLLCYIVTAVSLENMTCVWYLASQGYKRQISGQRWRLLWSQESAPKTSWSTDVLLIQVLQSIKLLHQGWAFGLSIGLMKRGLCI